MPYLETLTVKGFLSIRDQTLNLARLNVLIDANGAGKSNLIQVFHLLQHIAGGKLQLYIGVPFDANRLLHYGLQQTTCLEVTLTVRNDHLVNGYSLRMVPADNDTFVFEKEKVTFHDPEIYSQPLQQQLGSSH